MAFDKKGIGRREDCAYDDCRGPDCRQCPAFKPFPMFEIQTNQTVNRTYRVRAKDKAEASELVSWNDPTIKIVDENYEDDMEINKVTEIKVPKESPKPNPLTVKFPGFEKTGFEAVER